MSKMDNSRDADTNLRVVSIEPRTPGLRRGLQLIVLVATVIVASAGVLVARMALSGPVTPDSTLDARALASASPGVSAAAGPASTRLVLLGPRALIPAGAPFPAGTEVPVTLPALPTGSTAVLLDVTLSEAAGPGEVTVESSAGEVTALRLARAGAQTSASVVVAVGGAQPGTDTTILVRTGGGGRLVVNLIGAFEPARTATAGRLIAVPSTEVVNLVPRTQGKDATVDLSTVAALNGQKAAAVVLQFAADVGSNGGFVAVGPGADQLTQKILWNPTTPEDRIRGGFLVVPVSGNTVAMHYEAGNVLTADLIGYVTDQTAPESSTGLVVPVRPSGGSPVAVGPGQDQDVTLTGFEVPVEKVTGALLTVTATGDGLGAVTVHAPGTPPPVNPTLTAAPVGVRQTVTLVGTANGAVRVRAAAGATVTVSPLALLL